MGKRFKIIRPAPKPEMPVAALDLAEDTLRLAVAMKLLDEVNPNNLVPVETVNDRQYCRLILRDR